MIEIIPNWHPIVVHFTIALLTIATLFHVLATVSQDDKNRAQFSTVANWNLWTGAAISIVTVSAGWGAYHSVAHDTPSHLAMTEHGNLAVVTGSVFVLLAIWSFWRNKKALPINWILTLPLLVMTVMLLITAWKGGELVYRHGLGVMSLPDIDKHDHASHDHNTHTHSRQGEPARTNLDSDHHESSLGSANQAPSNDHQHAHDEHLH